MSDFKRAQRVAVEVHRALSDIVLRGLKDPRITSFSITEVRVTDDLRLARVRIVPLGGVGDSKKLLVGLKAASGFLSRQVAKKMRSKYSPKFEFFLDESLSDAISVLKGLDTIRDEDE